MRRRWSCILFVGGVNEEEAGLALAEGKDEKVLKEMMVNITMWSSYPNLCV